ncbi:hypothetical protein WJX79_008456 [Trebouxia sp. C0005]
MFGVDSVAATRQAGAKTASSEVSMPATRSDAVAESLLDSCTLLLLRCPAQSGEQLLELMDRFASIASLSSNSAAEEVRLKAIQCISAMLISSASKSAPSGPVSALKDPSKAPLIAYLFSILMKAAEGEMKAGLTGSKTLSAAALKAVRCLTQAVNDGDALAFVLPGLASGLAKIMISAGGSSKRPSGSKVGSESVVEGLQAFTSIVTATLGDLHAQAIAESEQAQAELSAQEALTALSKLAIQRQGRQLRFLNQKKRCSRVAVRTALAQAVTQLLEHCSIVLQDPNQALYEVLFTLAQDEWPQVSNHCHAWLCRCLPAQHKGAPLGGSVPAIVQRQLGGLLPALQSGEEAGTLHARRLTTALQACSPQQLTNLLVASPVNASSWASTLFANVARTLAKSAVAADQSNTISAGGAVLHGIVQDLLQVFEAQMPPQNTQSQASSSHTALGTEAQPSIAWQGRAAAAVVALTEVLYGASPAWQPAQAPISGSPTSSDDSRRRHNGGGSTSSSTAAVHGSGPLEQLVVQVLGDFSSADVWQLPTHVEPDASPEGSALTPQALGENAVLIRALLEAVGTFARVLGPRFASNGLILRKVLLLLLERLADPCPSVAASAGAALGSLCLHCCYPSRQALLTHNVDYLVDGLCRQLRSLQSYPRAPYLFAAVLQQAGAGPQLLPLLADPARAAFQGLSITARHNAAFHVYPFLQVLMHIVTICQAEAAVLLAATQAAADQIKDAVKAAQPHSAEDDPDEVSGPSDIDAIRAYFEQHNKAKAGAAADADVNYTAGLDVIEQLNSRRRQIHSVAVLAHASADVATPLLLAATLKVGLLASKVGLVALKALHATTAALDLYEQAITPVTSKKEGVGPPPSDTPQLLPSVHAIWGPLIGALRNDRPALVQAAMECLVGVCQLAGPQFMMRRVQTEAWPALVHLLKQGIPERRHLPYPAGRGALMAPAALQQMRYRVLHCVRQLGDAAQGSTLWKGMTDKVAEVVIVYLDGSQTATVQEAAAQALLKVAKLDPDAVWLLLQMHTSQNEFTQSPDRRTFPEAQQLLGGESATDSALQLPVVSPHLSALLHEVERMQSSWHKDT